MALRRNGEGCDVTAARPAGQDRPWARGGGCAGRNRSCHAAQPRDARRDDRDADDARGSWQTREISRTVPTLGNAQ